MFSSSLMFLISFYLSCLHVVLLLKSENGCLLSSMEYLFLNITSLRLYTPCFCLTLSHHVFYFPNYIPCNFFRYLFHVPLSTMYLTCSLTHPSSLFFPSFYFNFRFVGLGNHSLYFLAHDTLLYLVQARLL